MSEEDILEVTPPAGIPGTLFNALTATLYSAIKGRGLSRKRAQYIVVEMLDVLTRHYEELAEAENNDA